MQPPLLQIKNLNVVVGERPVLQGVNLAIEAGEIHILFGPNGSGKSTLLSAIMALPPYRVTHGAIWFARQRIDRLMTDEIARLGIGIAFQRPPSIKGVRLIDFLKALGGDTPELRREVAALDLAPFLQREINVGFSGGEIKRWEILKLFAQHPRLCLFDEPESGVDLEHIATVAAAINRLCSSPNQLSDRAMRPASLIVTHTGFILNDIQASQGHIMRDGRIIRSGDPRQLFAEIQAYGYGGEANRSASSH